MSKTFTKTKGKSRNQASASYCALAWFRDLPLVFVKVLDIYAPCEPTAPRKSAGPKVVQNSDFWLKLPVPGSGQVVVSFCHWKETIIEWVSVSRSSPPFAEVTNHAVVDVRYRQTMSS